MTNHYFETPTSNERRRTIQARIFDTEYEFVTANGVFSGDGLDIGTRVLLRECEPPTQATRVLDLGCGWGPIAVALADHCPDTLVDAVDINQRALDLCTENARRAGVDDRVRALQPGAVEPDIRYDEIWSNPPIRIGKEPLHDLLRQWLPRLVPGGLAWLVVGRNLGADSLQKWLVEEGYECDRVASAKGFRVFCVSHP